MKIRMHVQDGPKSYEFEHAGPRVIVGRNPAGDLVLEDDAAESVVSWEHARIDLSPREATLTDLGSTNGTYRNGKPVSGEVPLWPQDVVRFGQTGPTLTVRDLDLTPAVQPVAVPRPAMIPVEVPAQAVGVGAPVSRKNRGTNGARAPVAAPVISETRGIALQAVQNLMAQQEELRAQQAAQARHRRAIAGVAAVALLLFLLLGGGFLWSTGRLNLLGRKTDEIATDVAKTRGDVSELGEKMTKLAVDSANHFDSIDKQLTVQKDEQDKLMAKVDAVAQQAIEREAKLRGGMEKFMKDFGTTLDGLNAKLAGKPAEAGGKAVDAAGKVAPDEARQVIPPRKSGDPRIEPGMKIDAISKNGVYKGVLLAIEGTRVRMQTIQHPDAKASEFDIKDIQAFQTRDGIFALNESTGRFEPGITYYRFNKVSHVFERSDDGQDAYMAEDAKVLGPVNSAMALLAVGKGGEWVLGLPMPPSRSPGMMEAYHIKEIVTSKGVYTYDQSKQDYLYKSHFELASEAKAARDEYWKQVDEKQWQRRKESYKLGTERLRAVYGYVWRRWWWW
jgi:pSer/pThr/pTyr-binding forkhead associated (FHA) protein